MKQVLVAGKIRKKQRETEREIERQRETERARERQRETARYRERQTDVGCQLALTPKKSFSSTKLLEINREQKQK